jgi:hypothetical protein
MSEHEPPGYDDWFDEPEPPTLESGRGSRQSYDAPSETEEDVWTVPEDESRRARRSQRGGGVVVGGQSLTTTQIAIIAIAGLAVIIAILAALDVFTSSPAPTTVQSNTTATTLPTTTAITTTITVKLPTTTPLQLNDTGPQVKLLQAALKQLGFYTGAVDGSFGPATQSAVQQFQSANGLSPDGVVGPQTLTTLKQQVQQQSSG